MQPKTRKTEELEAAFNELAEQLNRETGFDSVGKKTVEHPAYQRIIGMGDNALPLIFRQIESDAIGPHWFEALKAITGANPVPRSLWGKIGAMEQVWLEWGREQGYRW
jgi:hypothetical protein